MRKNDILPTRFQDDSFYQSQAINNLAVKLHAVQNADDKKALLITSPNQFDGKTTVVEALARNYASAGQRVLVIDANPFDNRNIFSVTANRGLSYLLTDDEFRNEIETSIVETSVSNLFAIVSGEHLDEVIETVQGQQRLQQLIAELSQNFDIILIDGPAMDENRQSLDLALAIKQTLIVIRRNHSNVKTLDAAMDTFKQIDVKVMGSVVMDG